MKIPDGVNHKTFWEAAKKKGIKISSKYTGVYLNVNTNGSPSWMARTQAKGKFKCRRFELSECGEIEASKFYLLHNR